MSTSITTPDLVVGMDPDSRRTALAWAVRVPGGTAVSSVTARAGPTYRWVGIDGGGTGRDAVPWSRVIGMQAWLLDRASKHGIVASRIALAIESQAAKGKHSADVEELRRVRYHAEAACDLIGARCEHVSPSTWQPFFVAPDRPRGDGAMKVAYQSKAKALTNGRTKNEDQCAALGVLAWFVHSIGGVLVIDG